MISRLNLARRFAADHWEKALLAGIVLCVGLVLFRTRWNVLDHKLERSFADTDLDYASPLPFPATLQDVQIERPGFVRVEVPFAGVFLICPIAHRVLVRLWLVT